MAAPPRRALPFDIPRAATSAPLSLDLLGKFLHWDPSVRLSAAEALEHPWFASWRDPKDEGICERVSIDIPSCVVQKISDQFSRLVAAMRLLERGDRGSRARQGPHSR
jgi:serine/threonine protein kinase